MVMAKAAKKTASKSKSKTGASSLKRKKAKSGTNAEKEKLAKELKSLISKLDEEGLAFLVKQAHVHLYNMQVDALNKTIIKDEERIKKSASKNKTRLAENDFMDVKISETGSSFYIIYNNQWISFSKAEMTAVVKIAHGAGTELELKERLFNWLSRERNDLLYTASIANKFDNKLMTLINLLRVNFKISKN